MSFPNIQLGSLTRRGVAALILWSVATADVLADRWRRARASGDSGSENVAKAVLVAIVLATAVALGAAIKAVVARYTAQLQ
ncbi:hypothetical protein ACFS2C_23460 [Prauserella oleivorans]|uniref:Uncharacterized protein n=2 Tax=Prauserella TaxID=142577 RepID=A0A2V4AVE0_9PSEU|nr:hypothetical protein [Prauserella muralis]PXY25420.1 hypothetical protein BAY60_18775 [Prauserella muralis]TWE27534.1 hypothetical protein FHX69_0170 [Prauserella muralis]